MRRRTWEVVSVADPGDTASLYFDVFIMALIALNVVVVIVGTVPWIEAGFSELLWTFELVSVGVFSIEYGARVWAAVEDERYARPVVGRLRFARSPMAVIDFLAVAPFYLPFFGVDLRFLRSLRLLRIFRIAKLGRYVPAFYSLRNVIVRKKEELILSFSVLALLLVFAASLMYYAEHAAQPEAFSSIPATMWWAVATLTTVGYGDVYPITTIGRILASASAILGVGLFALPAGILASGLQEEWAVLKERQRMLGATVDLAEADDAKTPPPGHCPHCGRPL
jgi:voltage-gated potassium channel